MGRVDEGRQAYEQFFENWKKADTNLPLIVDAKTEYARFKATTRKPWKSRNRPTNRRADLAKSLPKQIRARSRRERRNEAYFAVPRLGGEGHEPLDLLFRELGAMAGHRPSRGVEVSLL
jgi:hypothetical protein